VVIGIKNRAYYKQVPPARIFMSKVLRKLIGILFNIPITDTQCGLKGFNKKGKSVFMKTEVDRYLCDLEFVYLCFREKPALMIDKREIALRPEVEFSDMNIMTLFKEVVNLFSILSKR